MEARTLITGIIISGIGALIIYGSLTGRLASMLAALFLPNLLSDTPPPVQGQGPSKPLPKAYA